MKALKLLQRYYFSKIRKVLSGYYRRHLLYVSPVTSVYLYVDFVVSLCMRFFPVSGWSLCCCFYLCRMEHEICICREQLLWSHHKMLHSHICAWNSSASGGSTLYFPWVSVIVFHFTVRNLRKCLNIFQAQTVFLLYKHAMVLQFSTGVFMSNLIILEACWDIPPL